MSKLCGLFIYGLLFRVRAVVPLLNIRIMCLSCAACSSMEWSKLCGLSIHGLLFRVRAAAPLLNIRIMCLSCAACPSMDCCFE